MYMVQHIALLVIGLLMVHVLKKYREKEFEWGDFIFWEALLAVLLMVSLRPVEISQEIKEILGLGRGLDALFVVAIGGVYLLVFRLYLMIDKVEREITELTREVGIRLRELEDRIERKA
ncbi:DUF2304 domain-containing protein [Pyrococcus yayanosii]|uniref:UDP-N-acetylglucosamine--dolichyl-phosphate N-acetylglucosaminephosphotransferase n=1 Tax=Pyrococcus yayanosii (strain CH1 / JCM 16557) TaxID=529709 RepID=F8AHI1_PYRYC|nr:hypothetical protein PYCH_04950 [Pyrococcus yayanosii CH1]